jgi:hypothetical protein
MTRTKNPTPAHHRARLTQRMTRTVEAVARRTTVAPDHVLLLGDPVTSPVARTLLRGREPIVAAVSRADLRRACGPLAGALDASLAKQPPGGGVWVVVAAYGGVEVVEARVEALDPPESAA